MLSDEIQDEFAMVSEKEQVFLDKSIQCHEYEADNADEVAIAIAAEYGQETPADREEHFQDELSQDEIDEDEAPANCITIKNPKDLEDVLNSLDHYCFETDSNSLSLVFQLRKHLASE